MQRWERKFYRIYKLMRLPQQITSSIFLYIRSLFNRWNMTDYALPVAHSLSMNLKHVDAVLKLLGEGATVPFIARYRKDVTGNLDEVQIQQIQDEAKFQKEFSERKSFILNAIEEQGKLTADIIEKLNAAVKISQLEDIYLPYKPKRKTKAQTARENGLQPLADRLLQQGNDDVFVMASEFINDKVESAEAALQGAVDIVAETINEDAQIREKMRRLYEQTGTVKSKVTAAKEQEAVKYKDYFDFSEAIAKIPSHRMLAVLRGFLEGLLRMEISTAEADAILLIEEQYVKGNSAASACIRKACKDAYRRLLQPAMETEFRAMLKQKADEEAIAVFAENLKQLLLSAPLGSKRILAIDPGYRTGCKVVCLDEKGELLYAGLIFIHEEKKLDEAAHTIKSLCTEYDIEAIAVGDGTAGRETEQFIKKLQLTADIFLVNEDGASVYSASETAREELPDKDITVRGAVSIGRRLMDPLAELVKIDPKSIGVGQYQHDVNQFRLKEKLDQTVEHCVNAVGVNLNTASKHLLSYVSGIGPALAENIVSYRKENGRFSTRNELLKVPRLGARAFEQCAGFLRIPGSAQVLDSSAVHPEAYGVVETMATHLNTSVADLIGNKEMIGKIDVKQFVTDKIGVHTLNDIIQELHKPGLDPRAEVQAFEYAPIFSIEDVLPGMIVPGIVTNLTRFGAFVDIGVKQDGLVHISEISHQYISDPSEKLKLNDKVMVKVIDTDVARKRINLSIKQTVEKPAYKKERRHGNTPQKGGAPSAGTMEDAMALLKRKFGK